MRKEGDSNPRIGFADYTLSRCEAFTRNRFIFTTLFIAIFSFASYLQANSLSK